jgi:hypothetical protein
MRISSNLDAALDKRPSMSETVIAGFGNAGFTACPI